MADSKIAGAIADPMNELVRRAQRSDHAAFEELMMHTSPASMRLAISILRNHHWAEEEVQNAYFNAWRHLGQFEANSQFSTWMSRIVANQCLMRLRSLRSKTHVSLDSAVRANGTAHTQELVDPFPNPESNSCEIEETGALNRAIGRLPPALRCVLIRRDIDELSTRETASHLGISTAAVKSRLLRARIQLKHRLRPILQGQVETGAGGTSPVAP